jgi:hypothetical protein
MLLIRRVLSLLCSTKWHKLNNKKRVLFNPQDSIFLPFSFCAISHIYAYERVRYDSIKGRFCKCEVRNVKGEVGSAECGMWSAKCGMRNVECGMRSAECGVRSARILFRVYG